MKKLMIFMGCVLVALSSATYAKCYSGYRSVTITNNSAEKEQIQVGVCKKGQARAFSSCKTDLTTIDYGKSHTFQCKARDGKCMCTFEVNTKGSDGNWKYQGDIRTKVSYSYQD